MADRVLHVVGDHQGREVLLVYELLGEVEDLYGRGRVEGRRVLVEKQELGLPQGRHQKGAGLALSAGEEADLGLQPVLEAEAQRREDLFVHLSLFFGDAPAEGPFLTSSEGEGEVFLELHVRGRAHHRILEDPAYVDGPFVLGHRRHVRAVEDYTPGIHRPDAGYGVEKRRFAGSVAADDRHEIARIEVEGEAVEGLFLVYGAGIEGLGDVFDIKHLCGLPSF